MPHDPDFEATAPSRRQPPIANSYWLPGGMIAAGEYPGAATAARTLERLGRFLDSGIRSFVDLTQPDDPLAPYDALLAEESHRRGIETRYARFGIPDMGVTDTASMSRILDYIDAEVAAGRPVYVHCWGGVGRTGTTIGCWLVHHGAHCDDALSTVASLFATMSPEKTERFPEGSPQTRSQRAMVQQWRQPATDSSQ